jgi:2-aminoethylphosphonate-pyruvate transaminase
MIRRLLLNPGPTNVHSSVREAAFRAPDWCHRDDEFACCVKRVCAKVLAAAGGDDAFAAVPFVSSGTGANEAMLSGLSGRVLVLVAGRYSERLWLIARRLGLDATRIDFDPLTGIDATRVQEALGADPAVTHLCVVHHETTTGVLAPLTELGGIAAHRGVSLLVDGISSIGGHDFDLVGEKVTMATLTANKCLESLPGVSFVLARKDAIERTKDGARSFYFDLHEQWVRSAESGKTPFTAAVPLFFALDVALDRLLAETVAGRAARYASLKTHLESKLRALGFSIVVPFENRAANVLSLTRPPAGWDYAALHAHLMRHDITIYTDEGTLRRGMFFFATMGDMSHADLDRFAALLDEFKCDVEATEALRCR